MVQFWKALALCSTPVDCRKKCGLRPVILWYTYSKLYWTHTCGSKMPLELWTGSCATVSHLCIFGTECYVHIPKQKRHKWDPKSTLGRLVGFMGEKDGYRIWMPNERKILLSRDVLLSRKLCAICATTSPKPKACSTLHVAPTEEIEVLGYENDGNTASTSGRK
jgi:hypothetical protein